MRAFIFPGQGSQSIGMGQLLAEASGKARDVFGEVDDALSFGLSRVMADGPIDALTLTENAQPAIMANAIATLRAAEIDPVAKSSFFAGHSLGEYSALCAASAIDLSATARLLRQRGQAMQAAVPVGEGAMAALLGASVEIGEKIAEAAAQNETCAIANDNDPGQVVISGHRGAIERAIEMAREMGAKRAILLPVSAPFHCALMAPAAEVMAQALAKVSIGQPLRPLYANVTAQPVQAPDTIRELLVRQVTGRVRWRESVVAMAEAGVTHFIELGAKVLGPMVKRTLPDALVTSVVTPDDIDALVKEL